MKTYGIVPSFKAGADCGMVSAVEIGDMKRDIAYHGDTVNTASRIQALCNAAERDFLVSKPFYELIATAEGFSAESLGTYLLKGKEKSVDIYSITSGRSYNHGRQPLLATDERRRLLIL